MIRETRDCTTLELLANLNAQVPLLADVCNFPQPHLQCTSYKISYFIVGMRTAKPRLEEL